MPRPPLAWQLVVEKSEGKWSPTEGEPFPQEIARMPYVMRELTARPARNDGSRAGWREGACSGTKCGSDLRGGPASMREGPGA